jgi:hypothetical protein
LVYGVAGVSLICMRCTEVSGVEVAGSKVKAFGLHAEP